MQPIRTILFAADFSENSIEAFHTACALAVGKQTRLVVLHRHRFEQLLRQDTAVATQLLAGMVTRLSTVVRQQNERLFRG